MEPVVEVEEVVTLFVVVVVPLFVVVVEAAVALSTTNATGEREVNVAVTVPSPALLSTFSQVFVVVF